MKRYWLPVTIAALCAILYGVPYIASILQLGPAYHGIPMMVTGDEETYIARIHDILDGHPLLGSPVFFEYKNQLPLMPPTGEWLYALPVIVFGFRLIDVIVASKFIFPGLLAVAVYWCFLTFIHERTAAARFFAAATSLVVVAGYDLVDLGHALGVLGGTVTPTDSLIWGRLVNPITGAVALFTYLASLNVVVKQRISQAWVPLLIGSASLAFMFASYFFSWGLAATITVLLIAFLLITHQYSAARRASILGAFGFVLASPYWYMLYTVMRSSSYQTGANLTGFFFTHQIILNKFVLITMAATALACITWYRRGGSGMLRDSRTLLLIASVLGSFAVFVQQLITGRAIWPFHFVQYTIPVLMVMWYVGVYVSLQMGLLKKIRLLIIGACICVLPLASLCYAVTVEARVYTYWMPTVVSQQRYAVLFQWLDANAQPDCVVVTREGADDDLNALIPAFSHCNVYTSNYRFINAPDLQTRFEHNYFVLLRLRGVTPENALAYMLSHEREARSYLAKNLQDYFGEQKFSDVPLTDFQGYLRSLNTAYRSFYNQDFRSELLQYRLDVIVSTQSLEPALRDSIHGIVSHGEIGGVSVYTLQ